MAGTRRRASIATAPFTVSGSTRGYFDVAGFEKFYQRRVFDRFRRHLAGLPGSEKQSFPAG